MTNLIAQVVQNKLDTYPANIQQLFRQLRTLVYEVATENALGEIEETLKWGEPAYLVKGGSTLRMDWQDKAPEHIYIFFSCKTLLVETFKEIYFDVFEFDGNRAIELDIARPLPVEELKQCMLMTLQYHKLKHLPLLGA